MAIGTLGAALIGAAGSVGAGLLSKSGADSAAEATREGSQAAADASRYAADLQMAQFGQTRNDLAPWRSTGANALNWLSRGMMGEGIKLPPSSMSPSGVSAPGMSPMMSGGGRGGGMAPGGMPGMGAPVSDYGSFEDSGSQAGNQNAFLNLFKTSPDYQFRLSEGTKALDRSAASRGMLLSGAHQKALNRFGQDTASGEYGNWYNRLAGLAGVGQTATTATGQFGAQAAGNAGNAMIAGGNAIAQGAQQAGQMRASGYNNLASGISSGVNNAMFANFMQPRFG